MIRIHCVAGHGVGSGHEWGQPPKLKLQQRSTENALGLQFVYLRQRRIVDDPPDLPGPLHNSRLQSVHLRGLRRRQRTLYARGEGGLLQWLSASEGLAPHAHATELRETVSLSVERHSNHMTRPDYCRAFSHFKDRHRPRPICQSHTNDSKSKMSKYCCKKQQL